MEYFWKENKRFVIAVGGGFLFLILYNSFVLSPIGKAADLAASSRNQKKRDMERRMSQGVANDESLAAAARRDRDQNRKVLASMTPEVGFTLGDRFQLRKGDKIKDYYDNLKLDLIKDLQKKATDGRVAFPKDLLLPDDASDETAVEVLSRLAVVERLVTLAVDSEVERIELVDGQVGMDRSERGPKKGGQFLTKYGVFMKVTGKEEAIFRIVHGAQKKGSYLAVTNFEMGRPDATKDLFEVSIGVALLKVDDKAGLEAK